MQLNLLYNATETKNVKEYYEQGIEIGRLQRGPGILEKERTEQILDRFLPKAPATILDVSGGTGVYSFWLAKKGYNVYLIDPVPFHIEEAKKMEKKEVPLKDCIIGDARKIEEVLHSMNRVHAGRALHLIRS